MGYLGGVYDFVPEFPTYPYVTIGEITWNDASGPAAAMAECTLALRIFSRQGGRAEASTIMERLHDLLHNATLAVSGYTMVFMTFASAQITLENDGFTYQGIMRFRTLLKGS